MAAEMIEAIMSVTEKRRENFLKSGFSTRTPLPPENGVGLPCLSQSISKYSLLNCIERWAKKKIAYPNMNLFKLNSAPNKTANKAPKQKYKNPPKINRSSAILIIFGK